MVIDVRKAFNGQGSTLLPPTIVAGDVQLSGACTPTQPEHITPFLNKDRMSRMKNVSFFSGLDLLKTPLWSVLPLEATFVSMVCCLSCTEVHVDVPGPTAARSCVAVYGPSYHQRPQ